MNLSYRIGYQIFSEIARGFFHYRAIGTEHIRRAGGALIVSNHVSFLDPPFVGIAFDEAIHFLARKTLFAHPLVGAVLRSWQSVPVDQERPDPAGIKAMVRLLRAGEKVLIFPEGNRSEDGGLQQAEAGVGLVIAKVPLRVIPARIYGAFEALPRHQTFPQPSRITVVFGPPWQVDPAAYVETGKELYQKIAAETMQRIGELTL